MNKKLSSIVHRCTDEHLRPLRRSIVKSCCPDRFAWSRAAVTRQVLIQFQRRCQIESNREYRGRAQRNARSLLSGELISLDKAKPKNGASGAQSCRQAGSQPQTTATKQCRCSIY